MLAELAKEEVSPAPVRAGSGKASVRTEFPKVCPLCLGKGVFFPRVSAVQCKPLFWAHPRGRGGLFVLGNWWVCLMLFQGGNLFILISLRNTLFHLWQEPDCSSALDLSYFKIPNEADQMLKGCQDYRPVGPIAFVINYDKAVQAATWSIQRRLWGSFPPL